MILFRVLLVICLMPVVLYASTPCSAAHETPDKSAALQFERNWIKVLQDKNVTALACLLAPNFKDTSWKGTLRSRAEVLRELPQRSSEYQQTIRDLDADLFGNIAIVRGLNVISDQQGHDVMRIRFTDVLQFSHGRWTAIAAQETPEQAQ